MCQPALALRQPLDEIPPHAKMLGEWRYPACHFQFALTIATYLEISALIAFHKTSALHEACLSHHAPVIDQHPNQRGDNGQRPLNHRGHFFHYHKRGLTNGLGHYASSDHLDWHDSFLPIHARLTQRLIIVGVVLLVFAQARKQRGMTLRLLA